MRADATLTDPLCATLAPAAPVAKLVIGKPAEEVAALIPRLFNLCRGAQEVAVHMALGLPMKAGVGETLAQDFARDHLVRLGILLPQRLGLDPLDVTGGAAALLPADLPTDAAGFADFLDSGEGVAPVLRALDAAFAPGEAVAELPMVTDETVTRAVPCENSVASRHFSHPLMQIIEYERGRGPVWRTMARVLDLADCARGVVPEPRQLSDGWVVVPASRGHYAMRAEVTDGKVTHFERVTPTDHLMAPDGIMSRALATLPEAKHALADLVVDVVDPCSPVSLSGGARDA